MRLSYYLGVSTLALALAAAGSASAQGDDATVEEVVVTGSIIAGTPEDAALPVDVINSETLQKQGSPTALDLIKQIPTVGAVLGDSNQSRPRPTAPSASARSTCGASAPSAPWCC